MGAVGDIRQMGGARCLRRRSLWPRVDSPTRVSANGDGIPLPHSAARQSIWLSGRDAAAALAYRLIAADTGMKPLLRARFLGEIRLPLT